MTRPERTGRHSALVVAPAAALPGAAGSPRGSTRARTALRAAATAVAATLLLAVLAALAAVVVVPRVAGAAPLVVLTGSMAPGIPAGSVVVVRPVDARTLRVGDVVTYQVADGSGALVTHRVVGLGHDAAGGVQLTTRGDANSDDDADPVPASSVRGELWYHVPGVGYVSELLRGGVGGVSERVLALLLAGGALLAYAVVQVVGAAGQRRRGASVPAAGGRAGRRGTAPAWAGRTASRELLVATLEVDGRDVDAAALDRLVEDLSATVVATTDTTVSLAVTAAPAVIDDAVVALGALAPVHVQRSGPLTAPLGPGSPQLRTGPGRAGRAGRARGGA